MTTEEMIEALEHRSTSADYDTPEKTIAKLRAAEEVASMLHIAIIGGYDDRHRLAMLRAWQAYHNAGKGDI